MTSRDSVSDNGSKLNVSHRFQSTPNRKGSAPTKQLKFILVRRGLDPHPHRLKQEEVFEKEKMLKAVSLALVVLLAAACVASADDVVVVTKANFEEVIKNNPYVLMEFYVRYFLFSLSKRKPSWRISLTVAHPILFFCRLLGAVTASVSNLSTKRLPPL